MCRFAARELVCRGPEIIHLLAQRAESFPQSTGTNTSSPLICQFPVVPSSRAWLGRGIVGLQVHWLWCQRIFKLAHVSLDVACGRPGAVGDDVDGAIVLQPGAHNQVAERTARSGRSDQVLCVIEVHHASQCAWFAASLTPPRRSMVQLASEGRNTWSSLRRA